MCARVCAYRGLLQRRFLLYFYFCPANSRIAYLHRLKSVIKQGLLLTVFKRDYIGVKL